MIRISKNHTVIRNTMEDSTLATNTLETSILKVKPHRAITDGINTHSILKLTESVRPLGSSLYSCLLGKGCGLDDAFPSLQQRKRNGSTSS